MKHKEGRFMVAVGAIVECVPTQKILLLKRSQHLDFRKGMWEYPIGRLKQFEDLEAGLKRELFEETKIQKFHRKKLINAFHFFRGKKNGENEVVGLVYWAIVEREEIHISHEHDQHQWFLPNDALAFVKEEWIRRDLELFIVEKSLNV